MNTVPVVMLNALMQGVNAMSHFFRTVFSVELIVIWPRFVAPYRILHLRLVYINYSQFVFDLKPRNH